MLVDTHCHLDFPEFDTDRDAAVRRAVQEGTPYIVNVGTDRVSSSRSVELSEKYPGVFATAGIHPCEAEKACIEDVEMIKASAASQKIRAIGETGLDFYYTRKFEEKQKEFFSYQAEIARSFGLPLIIHQRDAQKEIKDVIGSIKHLPEKIVFHCFSGDDGFLQWCVKNGYWISFTGILTFPKSANVVDAAKKAPLERLLIETDAPFLAPVPVRGKRNEPAYLRFILEKLAQVRDMNKEKLAEILFQNSCRFFNLPAQKVDVFLNNR